MSRTFPEIMKSWPMASVSFPIFLLIWAFRSAQFWTCVSVALCRCGDADPDAGQSRTTASAALDAVAAIRPRTWPNLLILELGDAVLVRISEIAAASAIYRRICPATIFRDVLAALFGRLQAVKEQSSKEQSSHDGCGS
jgi:hypothetical protein